MPRVDFLCLKFNSFDRKVFTEEVLSQTTSCWMLFYDFKHIDCRFYSADKDSWGFTLPFFFPRLGKIDKFILPFWGLLQLFVFWVYFAYFMLRYRPKVTWVEHTWCAFAAGLFRKFGVTRHCTYLLGDWLVSPKSSFGPRSWANNILFFYLDRWAYWLNDQNLCTTPEIIEARKDAWGGKMRDVNPLCPPEMTPYQQYVRPDRKGLLFLGRAMEDSGIEWLLDLLPELHEVHGIRLKIMGFPTHFRRVIDEQIKKRGLEHCTDSFTFVDSDQLYELIADCFCSTNLITSDYSHSKYTVPGKLAHSLQAIIPILITKNAGPMVREVERYGIGRICNTPGEPLKEAILDTFFNQEAYQQQILDYFGDLRERGVQSYLKTELFRG